MLADFLHFYLSNSLQVFVFPWHKAAVLSEWKRLWPNGSSRNLLNASSTGNTTTLCCLCTTRWVETKWAQACVHVWPASMLPAGGKTTHEARGVMSANGSTGTAAATFNYIRLSSEAMTARCTGLPLTFGPAFPSAPSPALPLVCGTTLKSWEGMIYRYDVTVLNYSFLITFFCITPFICAQKSVLFYLLHKNKFVTLK